MAEPAKYMFDRSFGPSSKAPADTPAERKLKADYERKLVETREAALKEGRAQGERAARATIEAETSRALAAVLTHAKAMQSVMAQEFDAIHAHAVKVAVTVAERLSREFLRREPLSEIEALLSDCLSHLSQTPHIIVRVNDTLVALTQRRLQEIAAAQSYEGQITVLGDAKIAVGDGRLEWAEGGIARNFQATLDNINDAIDRHMAARGREVRLRGGDAGAGAANDIPGDAR